MLINRNAPAAIPAPLIPVLTRPTISAFEVGAAAQIIDPTSKITTSYVSTHLVE